MIICNKAIGIPYSENYDIIDFPTHTPVESSHQCFPKYLEKVDGNVAVRAD